VTRYRIVRIGAALTTIGVWLALTAPLDPQGVPAEAAISAAAFNAWLQIPGVEGEAIKKGHENWIQVLSYGWGVAAASTAPRQRLARGAARPSLEDLQITKYLDRASPLLAGAAAEGKVYPEARLVFYGAAGTSAAPLGVVRMTGVTVGGLRVRSDSETGARPVEELALLFRTIEWSYNDIDLRSGAVRRTITAGWDVERNAPIGRSGGGGD
jgi:type VI secretion system secreted protein Hcp